MKLAIFDIDGTLTSTNRVDGQCFWASVQAALDVGSEPDWSDFAEVTDTAILADLCARHSREDYAAVEADVQTRFFAHLESTATTDPSAFRPIGGAEGILAHVQQAGWTPALATGGWRRSAEIKLSAAGIPTQGVPLASSSDHPRRVDIVREAIRKADPEGAASGVVLVGDALWDLRTAQALQLGFVGRAEGSAAQSLIDHGADAVVPHFGVRESLMSALERALGSSTEDSLTSRSRRTAHRAGTARPNRSAD